MFSQHQAEVSYTCGQDRTIRLNLTIILAQA